MSGSVRLEPCAGAQGLGFCYKHRASRGNQAEPSSKTEASRTCARGGTEGPPHRGFLIC